MWLRELNFMGILLGTLACLIGAAILIYRNGWRKGIRQIGFVFVLVASYVAALYFFGQNGKTLFAILLVIVAVGAVVYRKRRGERIW